MLNCLKLFLIPRRASSRLLFLIFNLFFVGNKLGDFLGFLGFGLLWRLGLGFLWLGNWCNFRLYFSAGTIFLGNDFVGVSNVSPAEPHVTAFFGSSNSTWLSLGVASTALMLFSSFFGYLGLAARADIFVRLFSLKKPPDAVDKVFLVSTTNLETVILAELIQNSSGTIVEIVTVLHGTGVFNLVGFENLLTLGFAGRIRNGVTEDMLEDSFDTLVNKINEGFFYFIGLKIVFGNKGVDDVFDGRHF